MRPRPIDWKPGTLKGYEAYQEGIPAEGAYTLNPYKQPDVRWFNFHTGFRWAFEDAQENKRRAKLTDK